MIDCFDGKFAFLSNFFDSPITDENGIVFPTVEHFFQAKKSTDLKQQKFIATQSTPGKAKRAGRRTELRPDWEDIKDEVMLTALRKKFSNKELKKKLLNTGDELLEEGNTWHDNYWGVCHCEKCQDILAKNHLGKLLMQLRNELK